MNCNILINLKVLNELSTDPALEAFRLEYEKLHRTLKISHENEVKLLTKCKDLNNDIRGFVLEKGKLPFVKLMPL